MIKNVMVRLDGTRADDAHLVTTDRVGSARWPMQRNVAPVSCPVCRRPVRFVIAPIGKLDLVSIDCPGGDPLYWPQLSKLMNGELRPPQ